MSEISSSEGKLVLFSEVLVGSSSSWCFFLCISAYFKVYLHFCIAPEFLVIFLCSFIENHLDWASEIQASKSIKLRNDRIG